MKLAADRLVVKRGEHIVLDGFTFEVVSGEALIVTGPNGAGKTTLLRTLAGLLRPDAGAVIIDGGSPELNVAQQCHYMGHLNGMSGSLTVAENLAFWVEYLDRPASDTRERVAQAIKAIALGELADIPVRYLSAGQKRRAALARLLVVERPIWLLDEPTASLDTEAAERLTAAVDAHTGDGGVAVVATHLPLPLARSRALSLNLQPIREPGVSW